ncbi:hypothetical protein HH310_05835 [Actinoplanes sp. TBRC 11911]|uniref:hypothetical protein n=1 Tax=Actinoplanes sp. TBRC 11911 TaxID=2729386 RepID=UPI00145E79F9|nr:hypothetical protein [Actinoplanes sp. TBRC 11911]NMO50714.1 hypothetical protein [Actinoplanes sp. TBRC 11911]
MHRSLGRRLGFGAVAAAAAITFAAPAHAAAPTVSLLVPGVTVAAGAATQVEPLLWADREVSVDDWAMTLELTGDLDGVAFVDPADEFADCQVDSPQKLTCTDPFTFDLSTTVTGTAFTPEIAASEAALGRTGKLTATFTGAGITTVTTSTDLTVAEGVDLVAGNEATVSAKPGDNFTTKLQVTNNTDKVVHGASLIFATDYGYAAPNEFSNCLYRADQLRACTFGQDLQPGATYEVTVPYLLRKDTAAPDEVFGEFQWLTAGDYDDLVKLLADRGLPGLGDPGTGDALPLAAKPAVRALTKQTDTNPDDNWQNVTVTSVGNQGTDFSAMPVTAKGAMGGTVDLPVGVRNNGPATLDWSRSADPAAAVIVTIPAGTQVTTVPAGCERSTDGSQQTNPKAVQYACYSSSLFPAGSVVTYDFRVKLVANVTNAQGLIEVNPPCECSRFSHDIDKTNDNATIVINPGRVVTGTPYHSPVRKAP